MSKLIDLTGQRFGRLTVIERAENDPYENVRWLCRCDCGNIVIRHGHNLKGSSEADCGCGRPVRAKKAATRHGGKNTRLYSIWVDMRRRCENPKNPSFSRYGGRGITVCLEWHDFAVFRTWAYAHGYSEFLTIDRIDNTRGYSPENCRWVTLKVQENNRRNNTVLLFKGEVHTLSQWAEITGIHRATIGRRIYNYGWSVERALTEPVHTEKGRKTKSKKP